MMAEVVGLVSGAVGIAAAAGQLINGIMKLQGFCSQIRQVPDEVKVAVDDLSTMIEVLEFVQIEMGHEALPFQPEHFSSSTKVLSHLQYSSQQVGEVLQEMEKKLGRKKYWGRIRAMGMTKKLDSAAKRVENAQRLLLLVLAAENRMTFRQSFNAQRIELTAISTGVSALACCPQFTGKPSTGTRTIQNIDTLEKVNEDTGTAGTAHHRAAQTKFGRRGRSSTNVRMRLPIAYFNLVWEFNVYKSNQGWHCNLRPYNIRPYNAPIFKAIKTGDLAQMCDLLHHGRASIWDRDPFGRGLLHYAAESCGTRDPTILEYLINSGADIYDVDFQGIPPYFSFESRQKKWPPEEPYMDGQQRSHLVTGFKLFMNHRDWTFPCPTWTLPREDGSAETLRASGNIVDCFPLYTNPPEEIISLVLQEMWPPLTDMPSTGRIQSIAGTLVSEMVHAKIRPRCIRACLSRKYIQETIAEWNPAPKLFLMCYAFDALAEASAEGWWEEADEARSLLKDMHVASNLIPTLSKCDSLRAFVSIYSDCSKRLFQGARMDAYKEGLHHYISELILVGIDMATLMDIDKKVIARRYELGARRTLYSWAMRKWYEIIAVDFGLETGDSHLWLSNPLDEWAGEFWDMIEHPERAIPGAWEDD